MKHEMKHIHSLVLNSDVQIVITFKYDYYLKIVSRALSSKLNQRLL